MNTDYELLTLAAMAINGGVWHPLTHSQKWQPLRNHKQAVALRHALRLTTGFDDRFSELGACMYATYPTGAHSCDSIMQNIDEAGGKRAALRRAIVRAAAEVQKMKLETSTGDPQ